MRRSLVLGGIWAVGIVVSVALAFAAVGRVASGVAPHDPARLSKTAIDDELTRLAASSTSTSTTPDATTVTGPSTTAPPVGTTTPGGTNPPEPPHVSTSQGGTLFTRCSTDGGIVYVASVPKTGYERTDDVEERDTIKQSFENANHRSVIEARCVNGAVVAEVHETPASTDD